MTLFRTRDIIMVVLMLGMAFWTYDVKYAARKEAQEVLNLERKIEIEKDTAKLLKARWALATDPGRIERLTQQYYAELKLEPITGRQIVKVTDIPERIPDNIETVIQKGDILVNNQSGNTPPTGLGVDNIATGSVGNNGIVIPVPMKKNAVIEQGFSINYDQKSSNSAVYNTLKNKQNQAQPPKRGEQ